MSALEMYWNSSAHIRASTWFRLEMMLSKFSSNFIITPSKCPLKLPISAYHCSMCQLALFHNMINPLTWIHCDDDDVECEKVDMKNLFLIIVQNTPLNKKQLNRHILFKKIWHKAQWHAYQNDKHIKHKINLHISMHCCFTLESLRRDSRNMQNAYKNIPQIDSM